MRNVWFPKKQAEYMTASRFRELGLTRSDIGERDPTFGTAASADTVDAPEPAVLAPAVLPTSVCATPAPPPYPVPYSALC